MPDAVKPHDPAVVEAVARNICVQMDENPDETFLCCNCTDPHPMWEAHMGDADMLLTALRAAGYQPVKLQ